jgi:solute carrier family 25 S-adenosylmethionine transporter 26
MATESGVQFTGLLKPMASGAIAGTTVDLFFYPIDTLKTRLQSRQGFLASGGFKGVYKGLGSVAVGSAPGGQSFILNLFITQLNTRSSCLDLLMPHLLVCQHSTYIHI